MRKRSRKRSRVETANRGLRYQSFVENNIDGVWRLDLEEPIPIDLPVMEQVELMYRHGYFGEANQALATQYGFKSPVEIIGFRLEEFLPRDLPTSIPLLTRLIEANYHAQEWESVECDKYGTRKDFLNNCIGEIENSLLLRIWGTARDITEQKQREEEIHLCAAMFDQIQEGCVIIEGQSEKIVYMNAAFTSITGYAESGLPGKQLGFLQNVITNPDTEANIRESIAQERVFQSEILNYNKDGTPSWCQVRISPIKDVNGVTSHYACIFTDITEKKHDEAERSKQQNEMTHLARVSTMGELTAALAHELNQPLTAILSNTQVALRSMQQGELDLDELREILTDIVADDKRAGELLRRIRRLVKRDKVKFELMDINKVIKDVLAFMDTDLAIKQVRVSTELTPNLPTLRGDPIHLQQVILNLIINACNAMQDVDTRERQIIITTQKLENSSVEIIITDYGHGIDEKINKKIFQAFYTTKEEGMGMGLAISRTIMELHGGRIWAENRPDKGAVFHLTLPLMPEGD